MAGVAGETEEREMGFEPTTAALEGRGSSAELLPLANRDPTVLEGPISASWYIISGRQAAVDIGY